MNALIACQQCFDFGYSVFISDDNRQFFLLPYNFEIPRKKHIIYVPCECEAGKRAVNLQI